MVTLRGGSLHIGDRMCDRRLATIVTAASVVCIVVCGGLSRLATPPPSRRHGRLDQSADERGEHHKLHQREARHIQDHPHANVNELLLYTAWFSLWTALTAVMSSAGRCRVTDSGGADQALSNTRGS